MKRKSVMFGMAIVAILFVVGLVVIGALDPTTALAVPFIPVIGAALTQDRNTPQRDGDIINIGVAAGKKIYAGALVALDANGYATPGATATTLKGLGRAEEQVDNSSGSNGDVAVNVRKGIFRFANEATDQVTAADIGNNCYIVDDQTVAKTDGTGTRSVAGKVFDVDSQGVWVDMR